MNEIVAWRPGMQEGVMMHDMAITEDFAILLDVPLVFRPEVSPHVIWQILYHRFIASTLGAGCCLESHDALLMFRT